MSMSFSQSAISQLKNTLSNIVVKKGIEYTVKAVMNTKGSSLSGNPGPYIFRGGSPTDYVVEVGPSGTWHTKHLQSGKVIQSVIPGGNMLGLATLGVGLINMGLGLYNTYQLHKVRGQLDSIHSDLYGVKETLRVHGRILEILDAKQDQILDGLALLRTEMRTGFETVQKILENQEATRRRELYEEKIYKFFVAYQDCIELEFADGESNILRDRADNLEAWLMSQMQTISKKEPRYFPLFQAWVFARRAKIDVFQAKGEQYAHKATLESQRLIESIRDVLSAFLDQKTLYELTVSHHEIFSGYMNLYKGVKQGHKILQNSNDLVDFGIWDDGFEIFREMLAEDEQERVLAHHKKNIKTLSDAQWYIAYCEEDPNTFDISNAKTVSVGEMLQKMGHPHPARSSIKKERQPLLEELVLPHVRELFEKAIQEETGCQDFQISYKQQGIAIPSLSVHQFGQGNRQHELVCIPKGTFEMGALEGDRDADDREKPRHLVSISRDILVGKYPVTQGLYESVMGKNPSKFKGSTRPVENVSWYDAVSFCNKLSALEGREVMYTINGDDVSCNFGAKGYRLLTEAEWEYCARSGERFKYSGSNNLDEVAWYLDNSGGETHPVGLKKPNGFGLYDMSGNVWEWVWDWYGGYSSGTQVDPQGPTSGSLRVLRGGSWLRNARNMRVSYRNNDTPADTNSNLGFRLGLTP